MCQVRFQTHMYMIICNFLLIFKVNRRKNDLFIKSGSCVRGQREAKWLEVLLIDQQTPIPKNYRHNHHYDYQHCQNHRENNLRAAVRIIIPEQGGTKR